MKAIASTPGELIPQTELREAGLQLLPESDSARFGYPIGLDIWECLWFEIVNSLRFGPDWRTAR